MKPTLTLADIAREAAELGVSSAKVGAVLQVEAPRGGFQDDDQVSILFERHYFHRLTNGRYDKTHPDISNPVAGGYGKYSEQHAKLQRAVALDRDAALSSASWGKPQIMGANWKQAGAASLQDFINRMSISEAEQLKLFVNFIKNDKQRVNPKTLAPDPNGMSLWGALKVGDWRVFARIYNGPGYAKNQYDVKLKAAYAAHGGK